MHSLTVTLLAFLCLTGAALAGIVCNARMKLCRVLLASPPPLRAAAAGLMLIAGFALMLAILSLRTTYRDAGERVAAFSDEVAAMDRTLRQFGAVAGPARMLLFRLAERKSRELSPVHGFVVPFDTEPSIALYDALSAEIATLLALPERNGTMAAATLATLEQALGRVNDGVTVEPPDLIAAGLLVWLMLGLAVLGIVFGPRGAGVLAVMGLAVVLAGGIFLVEEAAWPIGGGALLARAPLEAVLFVITN